METKITRWGNSLAVRVSKELADKVGLYNNQYVKLVSGQKGITIEPIQDKKLRLEDLLAQIKPGQSHKEEDWGKKQGNEAW